MFTKCVRILKTFPLRQRGPVLIIRIYLVLVVRILNSIPLDNPLLDQTFEHVFCDADTSEAFSKLEGTQIQLNSSCHVELQNVTDLESCSRLCTQNKSECAAFSFNANMQECRVVGVCLLVPVENSSVSVTYISSKVFIASV